MARGRWLTPASTPTETKCAVLELPDGLEYRAAFRGALLLLADPDNWEPYGSVTPDEVANTFLLALEALDATWSTCT